MVVEMAAVAGDRLQREGWWLASPPGADGARNWRWLRAEEGLRVNEEVVADERRCNSEVELVKGFREKAAERENAVKGWGVADYRERGRSGERQGWRGRVREGEAETAGMLRDGEEMAAAEWRRWSRVAAWMGVAEDEREAREEWEATAGRKP
ncbi:hypothetical protein AMTR_s00018p00256290 [Amborella trichopoda]|uniref:Uncharacterized protein n=1 Tax=Amborella trichopoda TaxID=13333 RepID=W1PEA7_AMBTC|nr:hypothetical protein AMTR_s00018p00256290 [Amborella trichopoda]